MNKKQQSKQLLILAGPSCAGKSTLIKKIREKQLPAGIYQQLKVKNLSDLAVFEDNDLEAIMLEQFGDSIVIHYDLFNNYLNQNYHQNILRIVKQFDSVSIVTLYVSRKILLKRIQYRILRTFIKICLKPSYFRGGLLYFGYQWDKYQRYLRSDIASEIYREWLKFTKDSWVSSHWILDSTLSEPKIQPVRVLTAKQI